VPPRASNNKVDGVPRATATRATPCRWHQAKDDVHLINWEQMTQFVRLALGFAVELGLAIATPAA